MSEKIRLFCEGDMNCTNAVFMTKKELIGLNKESKLVTCPDCNPRYGNEIRADPFNSVEFEDDIDKPSNPEEPI